MSAVAKPNFMEECEEVTEKLLRLQNKECEKLNPHVGVFYFVNDEILYYSGVWWDHYDDQALCAEHPTEVEEYWSMMSTANKEYRKYNYTHFPCGWVRYNADADESDIWLDKCINEEKYRDIICKSFHLNPQKVF